MIRDSQIDLRGLIESLDTAEAWLAMHERSQGHFRKSARVDWMDYATVLQAWQGETGGTDPGASTSKSLGILSFIAAFVRYPMSASETLCSLTRNLSIQSLANIATILRSYTSCHSGAKMQSQSS